MQNIQNDGNEDDGREKHSFTPSLSGRARCAVLVFKPKRLQVYYNSTLLLLTPVGPQMFNTPLGLRVRIDDGVSVIGRRGYTNQLTR